MSKKKLRARIKRLEHEKSVLIDDPESEEAAEIRVRYLALKSLCKLLTGS